MLEGLYIERHKPPERYTVHSFGNAGREIRGPFCSELIYEIEVNDLLPSGKQGSSSPLARNEIAITRVLKEKYENGELSDTEIKQIAGHIKLGALGKNITA